MKRPAIKIAKTILSAIEKHSGLFMVILGFELKGLACIGRCTAT
jgi:hypothetical protein